MILTIIQVTCSIVIGKAELAIRQMSVYKSQQNLPSRERSMATSRESNHPVALKSNQTSNIQSCNPLKYSAIDSRTPLFHMKRFAHTCSLNPNGRGTPRCDNTREHNSLATISLSFLCYYNDSLDYIVITAAQVKAWFNLGDSNSNIILHVLSQSTYSSCTFSMHVSAEKSNAIIFYSQAFSTGKYLLKRL